MAASYQNNIEPAPQGNGSSGGTLILLALLALASVVIYNAFFSNSPNFISKMFQTPQAVQVTYVPSDFEPQINDENALAILGNPQKYRKQFDALVYNFNISLLYHIANRMNLQDSVKQRLVPEYEKQHGYLTEMYYNDSINIKDPGSAAHEKWYANNIKTAVEAFNEVAGKYTSFLVTKIFGTLIKLDAGKFMAKGKSIQTPCGIAINEALRPMMNRWQEKATIMDFSASRGYLKEKVTRGVTELATYEIQARKGINKQLQYKILGYSVSTTDIQMSAISNIKAGFKLDDYFDITLNPKKGIVYITLPEPTVLSHEVYPRVDNLDVGWLAGIQGDEMNKNLNALRREFRADAINNDQLLERAKSRADSVMQLMLAPVVRGLNKRYDIKVRFKGTQQKTTKIERMRQGTEIYGEPQQQAQQNTSNSGDFIPQ